MKTRGIKRQLTGTVVSDKMDKTAVVQVERLVKHPAIQEISSTDAINSPPTMKRTNAKSGDKVVITESRPISKLKRWRMYLTLSKEPYSDKGR
jgi:small subunit ribosomal protein S17